MFGFLKRKKTSALDFQKLEKELEDLYGISAMTVYAYTPSDFIRPKCVYGARLSAITVEKYLSLKVTTIFRSAMGFEDAPQYRARHVSTYSVGKREYMVILSSSKFEGFANRLGITVKIASSIGR